MPDPSPIPRWMTDVDEPGPCPCGRPLDPNVIPVEGDAGLVRWFHEECLSFLEYEMSPEEIEEKQEWERRQAEEEDDE